MSLKKTDFLPIENKQKLKPLEFPNCIHLSERYGCHVLNRTECIGKGCSFCQSKEEHHQSYEKWIHSLNNLNIERQKQIAMKYHNGKMPWHV